MGFNSGFKGLTVVLFERQRLCHPPRCQTILSYSNRYVPTMMCCGRYTELQCTRSWHLILSEKLTVGQIVKKLTAFYGIRMFITVFTSARHLSLSWAKSIQSIPLYHLLKIHLNISLPSTPWSFPQVFPPKPCLHLSSPICATCPAHLLLFDLINRIICSAKYKSLSS